MTLFGAGARIRRATKFFLIFLFAAIVSLLIPVLHFLLVPGFLLAALIMSVIKFKETGSIDLTRFGCPSCAKEFPDKKVPLRDDRRSVRL